ncbi:MAG: hypothetical protein ACRDTG_11055 [Pseudonocardiaceae bacterium]
MTTTPTADVAYLNERNRACRPEPAEQLVRWQRALLGAAERAVELYPGPVGELIARELHDALQFEFMAATDGQTHRLVKYLLAQPPEAASNPHDGSPAGGERCSGAVA